MNVEQSTYEDEWVFYNPDEMLSNQVIIVDKRTVVNVNEWQ